MNEDDLGATVCKVVFAPLDEGDKGGRQRNPGWSEAVLVARRVFLVTLLGHDVAGHQSLESFGEDGASDAQVVGEVVEPADTAKRSPDDQDAPPIAHQFERALEGGVVGCFVWLLV